VEAYLPTAILLDPLEVALYSRDGSPGIALIVGCFAGGILAFSSAAADPLSDSEKIERLERQTELLREQLGRQNDLITTLQREVAQTKKKTEKKKAEPAKASEPSVASVDSKPPDPPVNSKPEGPPPYLPTRAEVIRGTEPAVVSTLPSFGGVRFSVWGWLEAATVFRDHNQVNDMLTVFNAIPYPYSPLYKEHEFHGSARQSQFSFLAEGDIDSAQKLTAYLETDFLGIGQESNYLITNDWAPRLRHGYLTYTMTTGVSTSSPGSNGA
jgi:hypothetical protein